MSAQEAVSHVQSGDKIIVGDWVGEPPALMRALIERAPELRNVEIIHGLSPGPNTHLLPEYAESFHHTSLFLGPKSRKSVQEGLAGYIGGTCFHKWPEMFAKSTALNPHIALVQVSLPDENGMCSWGNSCCYTEPAARTAAMVIAQINAQVPTLGGKKIALKDIDYIVENDEPIYTLPRPAIGKVEATIGEYIAGLVENGATIQLGLGAMPDAVANFLKNKKDLGVHSETLTESMMELVKCGVITNKMKTLNPGICVGAQAAGTREFYDFLDHNPIFAVQPVDYV